MKPYAAQKALNRELQEADVRLRRVVFESNPLNLIVEPTNRCNAHCPICARHFWDRKANPPADLKPATIHALREFMITAETVFAFGHGEPLIGRHFWELVRSAKEYGCRVEVTTNGLALGPAEIDRLVELDVEVLNLSLDAVTDAALLARRGVSIGKIEDVLRYLAERRAAMNSPRPEVGFAVVLDRDNLDELPGLVSFAADLFVRRLLINHLVAWDETLHARSAYQVPEQMRAALDDLQTRAAARNLELILPFAAVHDGVCPHPLQMFTVRANGEVWPCCHAVFRNERYSYPVGNVHDHAPRSIWNGEAYQALRRAFLCAGAPPALCRVCPLLNDELASHLRSLK